MHSTLILLSLFCIQPQAQPAPMNHPLHEAAAAGDVAAVKKWLAQDVPVDTPTRADIGYGPVKCPWASIFHCYLEPGSTPLLVAIVKQKPAVIKLLLDNKANASAKDKWGYTTLHYAGKFGDVDTVKLLLKHGAKLKDEPGLFADAVKLGWIDLAKYLLEQGVDINAGGFADYTALHWAVSRGDVKAAEWLLDKGASINKKGYPQATPGNHTPLTLAVIGERADMVALLLKRGADQTLADNTKQAPLHIAIDKKNLEMVQLLAAAADKKFLDQGQFLHQAINKNFSKLIPVLLDCGANINARDAKGRAPLHVACELGKIELVGVLLQHKADLEATDDHGRTPLFYAVVQASRVQHTTSGLIHGQPLFLPMDKAKPPFPQVPPAPKEKALVYPEGRHHEGALEQLVLLLHRGAKVNVADKGGLTPLHYAALIENDAAFREITGLPVFTQHAHMVGGASWFHTIDQFNGHAAVRLLLDRGADPQSKSKAGKTALDLTINSKTRERLEQAVHGQK